MSHTLLNSIQALLEAARTHVSRQVNSTMTLTYFLIGRYIVEDEQQGEARAGYAEETLKYLSLGLTQLYKRGFSVNNLQNMRSFYVTYQHHGDTQAILEGIKPPQSQSGNEVAPIHQTLSVNFNSDRPVFPLSWSHYLILCRIERKEERSFYEIEATENDWSVRELKRQYDSSLYERLVLSRNKEEVKQLAEKGQRIERPAHAIKDPLVLEFLGLEEKATYSETDLEAAIITQLEHFMLELGKGFLFAGRQVRFTYDEEHYFVDLVFYNRLLRCFVLIDLKIGKLKHQDLGQMQMYVHYYDRFVKAEEENKTIGIIICKDKNDAMVEITLPSGNDQIFASKYQLYLPSKSELRQQVLEQVENYQASNPGESQK